MLSSFIDYISLGPSCIPAEMLKAANLRSCTYGFDWFRSGGFFVRQLISMDLDSFLSRYVFNPCIPLQQVSINNRIEDSTLEITPIDPVYGFNYLYNPHRIYSNPDSLEYFKRSFIRLKDSMTNPQKHKKFIIADYTNKPHYDHINDPIRAKNYLDTTFRRFKIINYEIHIIRISLVDISINTSNKLFVHSREEIQDSHLHNFSIHKFMDDDLWLRRKLYKHIINSAIL